jgi:DNA-binding response OmpR family regulator
MMTPDAINGGRKRILMVDDEEELLLPMALYFRHHGYDVVTAQEREEAEALLEHHHFDVVLLDLALSRCGLEGLDILREVHGSGRHATRVIVLSGCVTPEVEAEALSRGAHAVLHKPQPLRDILDLARQLIADRS